MQGCVIAFRHTQTNSILPGITVSFHLKSRKPVVMFKGFWPKTFSGQQKILFWIFKGGEKMFVRHFIIIIVNVIIIITKHHLCLQKENLCPFEHFYIHLTLTQAQLYRKRNSCTWSVNCLLNFSAFRVLNISVVQRLSTKTDDWMQRNFCSSYFHPPRSFVCQKKYRKQHLVEKEDSVPLFIFMREAAFSSFHRLV